MTITPWHSIEDFEIAERHNLDKEQIIDKYGRLLPIAGEFNEMKISEARPKILEKLKSYKTIFSLIMFDLDHFKNVNDTYGHSTGDLVLKTLSEIILKSINILFHNCIFQIFVIGDPAPRPPGPEYFYFFFIKLN